MKTYVNASCAPYTGSIFNWQDELNVGVDSPNSICLYAAKLFGSIFKTYRELSVRVTNHFSYLTLAFHWILRFLLQVLGGLAGILHFNQRQDVDKPWGLVPRCFEVRRDYTQRLEEVQKQTDNKRQNMCKGQEQDCESDVKPWWACWTQTGQSRWDQEETTEMIAAR